MRVILLTALLMGLAGPVWADFETGNSIYSLCEAKEVWKRATCHSYIIGVFDARWSEGKSAALPTCPPKGITRKQVQDVVLAWLKDHPANRHEDASILIHVALFKAWPCK